jgi:hypothetical protein
MRTTHAGLAKQQGGPRRVDPVAEIEVTLLVAIGDGEVGARRRQHIDDLVLLDSSESISAT